MVMNLNEIKASPNYKWFVMANVAVGTFMSTLDSSIVNVTLPTMSTYFKANINLIQWVVSIYLLTTSSLLLVFGRCADILGRKKIYSLGFIVFIIGSAFCGFSQSVYMLIASRAVQATGAAMMMANGMGIITSIFPPKERGRALGLIGTVVAAGSMTGPTLGGILVTAFGWPSIFLVNLPIGLIGFFASRWFLPDDNSCEIQEPFDWAGAILFASGMSLFLWGLTQGEQIGWTKPVIYGSLIISILALVVFLYRALTTRYPIIDLSLFKNWVFLGGNLAGLVSFISMFATTLIMPFYMKGVLHFQEMHIGLMMTPFPLAMAIVAPISGWLSDRLGYLALTTSGLLLNVAGLMLLATLNTNSSSLFIASCMTMLGVGMGLFQSPNNSSVMGAVPPQKLGIAGGINALVRNVGMVTGIAFSVSLLSYGRAVYLKGIAAPTDAQQAAAFVSSMSTVFHWAAFIALIGIFFSTVRIKAGKTPVMQK